MTELEQWKAMVRWIAVSLKVEFEDSLNVGFDILIAVGDLRKVIAKQERTIEAARVTLGGNRDGWRTV